MTWTASTAPRDNAAARSAARYDDPIVINWVTDTHLSIYDGLDPDDPNAIRANIHLYSGQAKLERWARELRRNTPTITIHTGDFIDQDATEVPTFMRYWNRVPGEKELVIGNHDLYDATYEQWVQALGYGNRPVVAGSVFNRSFRVETSTTACRMIFVDTNINPSDGHVAMVKGRLLRDGADWLASEVADAEEPNCIIWSHHGPYRVAQSEFEADDASYVASALESAVSGKTGFRLWWLYGHGHAGFLAPKWDVSLGEHMPGIMGPALIDLNPGYYVEVVLRPDGTLGMQRFPCSWPYPT